MLYSFSERYVLMTENELPLFDGVSYIPAGNEPLSADIGVFRCRSGIWLFDAGYGEKPLKAVQALGTDLTVVISHFHQDHMGNVPQLPIKSLYGGGFTVKKLGFGNEVKEDVCIEDGLLMHILPLPSSHAKGSLCLEVNEKYVFTGDGLGGAMVKGEYCHNVGMLKECINTLKRLKAEYVIQSHRFDQILPKQEVIDRLEKLYACREKNNSYIIIKE